jgi:hypothetical protein
MEAKTGPGLNLIGILWVVLTLSFEVGMGRFVLAYSWERIWSDFNLARGGLLGIGLLIMGFAPRFTASLRRVRASSLERDCPLPGDDRIPEPVGCLTHAITIHCSSENLWPWLAQMGAGRAGWYSYDSVDNSGRRSAQRVLPEFQNISVGTLFPALPGATDAFLVLAFEPARFLVLGAVPRKSAYAATWAFVLEELGTDTTRLIVRVRVNADYRFHGLPLAVVKLIHYVMQRKQLLEIAARAEVASMVASDLRIAS